MASIRIEFDNGERIMKTTIDCEMLPNSSLSIKVDDSKLEILYDIRGSVEEIERRNAKRVALQFPDSMLVDAMRVSNLLKKVSDYIRIIFQHLNIRTEIILYIVSFKRCIVICIGRYIIFTLLCR